MFANKLSKSHFYILMLQIYEATELKNGKRYFYLSSPTEVTKQFIIHARRLGFITFCHNVLIGSQVCPVFMFTQRGVRVNNAVFKKLNGGM